jgi:hypothetical protein
MEFRGIFHGIPLNSMKFHQPQFNKIPWNSMEFHEKFNGIPWNFMEFSLPVKTEFHQIPSIDESPWNYIPWNFP